MRKKGKRGKGDKDKKNKKDSKDKGDKNKKAISALIATVMLIVITMAAVVIIWQVVVPLIRTGTEQSKACMDAQLTVDTQTGYTYWENKTDGNYTVSVMVSRGEKEATISGVQVKIRGSEGASKVFEKEGAPGVNEDLVYTVGGETEETEYNEAELGVPVSVAVGAIVGAGEKKYSCPLTPETVLSEKK